MKTTWTNVNDSFPSLNAKNSTTSTSKDGTPINKDLVDELFGVLQAVISQGNVTPNDSSEVYNDSDFVEGIRNIAGSPGEIVYKVNTDVADSYAFGERLLFLDGSTVLCTSYPELTERAYCGDSHNATAYGFYRCNSSDGTNRSTTGVYLFLPDYRGYFIRCLGHGDSVDPAGPVRPAHVSQNTAIITHDHYIQIPSTGYYATWGFHNILGGSDLGLEFLISTGTIFASEISTSSATSNEYETRPINRAVYAYVRY